MPVNVFFKDARGVFKYDEIGREILGIALPAALAVAADPIASLIDTAFVGHIGPVELAAVGVSIAIFNQASRITIFPLVSITTSFVAEEDTIGKAAKKAAKVDAEKCLADVNSVKVCVPEDHENEEKLAAKQDHANLNHEPTRSNISIGKDGVKENKESSSTENGTKEPIPDNGALQDLKKDLSTKVLESTSAKSKRKEKKQIASASTALIFGTILGLMQAIFLIFGAKSLLNLMGVKDNSPMFAPAHKYLTLRSLGAPAVLLSLAMQGIFRGFKDTRTPLYVIVAGYTVNIILDPILIFVCHWGVKGAAAAHVLSQYFIVTILFWRLVQKVNLMPPSLKDLQFGRFLKNGGLLLARVVAVTFCAILASAFAEKDYEKTTATATRVLQMSFILGVGLAIIVGIGMFFGAGIFSRDIHVQHLIHLAIPFVAATQPINSLAFVFDGVNFGASDFAYSAYSLVLVAIASVVSLFLLSKSNGFIGIWIALTIYMLLRAFVGVWRMSTGTGPWRYLRTQRLP
uniref:Protein DETOXIFICATION n=1 Tax=Cucumis sativus TaxID=3659 RepID=A0A0A0K8B8_CUCSA